MTRQGAAPGGLKWVVVHMPQAQHDALTLQAEDEGMTTSELMRRALTLYLHQRAGGAR